MSTDTTRAALSNARDLIATVRQSFVDCSRLKDTRTDDPIAHGLVAVEDDVWLTPADAECVREHDGALAQIDAALAQPQQAAPAGQAAAPAKPACKYGDPFCPCQDGDLCHYEGTNPMQAPAAEAVQPPAQAVRLTDAQISEAMEAADFTYQPTKFARVLERAVWAANGLRGEQ